MTICHGFWHGFCHHFCHLFVTFLVPYFAILLSCDFDPLFEVLFDPLFDHLFDHLFLIFWWHILSSFKIPVVDTFFTSRNIHVSCDSVWCVHSVHKSASYVHARCMTDRWMPLLACVRSWYIFRRKPQNLRPGQNGLFFTSYSDPCGDFMLF